MDRSLPRPLKKTILEYLERSKKLHRKYNAKQDSLRKLQQQRERQEVPRSLRVQAKLVVSNELQTALPARVPAMINQFEALKQQFQLQALDIIITVQQDELHLLESSLQEVKDELRDRVLEYCKLACNADPDFEHTNIDWDGIEDEEPGNNTYIAIFHDAMAEFKDLFDKFKLAERYQQADTSIRLIDKQNKQAAAADTEMETPNQDLVNVLIDRKLQSIKNQLRQLRIDPKGAKPKERKNARAGVKGATVSKNKQRPTPRPDAAKGTSASNKGRSDKKPSASKRKRSNAAEKQQRGAKHARS